MNENNNVNFNQDPSFQKNNNYAPNQPPPNFQPQYNPNQPPPNFQPQYNPNQPPSPNNVKLKPCPNCRMMIDKKSKICPYCHKKTHFVSLLGVLLAILIGLLVFIFTIMFLYSYFTATDNIKNKVKEAKIGQEESKDDEAENLMLYDENGITITYKGIEKKSSSVNIKLLIENSTDKTYEVQVRDFSINGYMVEPAFSAEVAGGKKTNDEISIRNRDLKDNDISFDDIYEAEFYFNIFDWNDIFDDSFDSEVITIKFK